ncbi:MAG: lectin like domain-containing protein [Candidatus Marinimicrobia bacterium]|nr:lectin like domain-containing protein [Candidatus Neomarinimicrobiota bacterium]
MFKKYNCLGLIFIILASGLSADPLPAQFDLRNDGGVVYVSLVKSQQGGTCWAHGTMASIESNLMRTGTWDLSEVFTGPDLAEYHLDWWNGFNLFFNQDLGYYPQEGLVVHMGGDYRVSSAYFSRGDGAVLNENAPNYKSASPLRDTSYTYYYPRTIEWYQLKDDLSNIDFIKQKIMDHGAVATCMYACPQFLDDSTNGSFYQPPFDSNDPNHSIAIVGWNDTITTAAPEPGAWLCKNSWGINWGSVWNGHGYFWISYYDKHAVHHPEMGCVSFQEVELMRYDSIYYHDYHGWRDTLDVQEAVNIFVAESRDTLVAVSFFAAADSVEYIIKLYRDREDLLNDAPDRSQSGTIYHAGFHTIDLDNNAVLMEGDSFFVYLYLDKGGQPYDRTSVVPVLLDVPALYAQVTEATTVPSTAGPNESLFRQSGGSWTDFQTVNTTANFCIKALVKKGKFSLQQPAPETSGLLGIYPNPTNGQLVIDFQLSHSAEVRLLLYDINGKLRKILQKRTWLEGYRWNDYDVSDLSSGIYICIFEVDGALIDTQKILVVK